MPLRYLTSIKRKLTLLVMLTTSVALLLTAAQFVINDVRDYRHRVLNDLLTIARMVGQNCTSPIEFDDTKEAARTLSALQEKPHVLAAAVYKDKRLFAVYTA